MNTKIRNILTVALLLGFVLVFAVWGVLKPDDLISDRERRPLAGKPELTLSTLKNGSYMTKYETYSADQFPLRDGFSKLKIFTALDVFRQKDVNGFYSAQGHASQLDYPLNEKSVENAARKFSYIYNRYLSDKNAKVYLSVIPDKNSFLAEPNGYVAFEDLPEDYRKVPPRTPASVRDNEDDDLDDDDEDLDDDDEDDENDEDKEEEELIYSEDE